MTTLGNVSSTPGDKRAKARRAALEALEALETARKRYDAAREQLDQQRLKVTSAQCELATSVTRLQAARDAFERLQEIHVEDEAQLNAKVERKPAVLLP